MFLTVLDIIALITNKVMDMHSGPPQGRYYDQFTEKLQGIVLDFLFPDFPQQSLQQPGFMVLVNGNKGMLLLFKAYLHSLPRELNPSIMLITRLHDQKFHPKVELNRVHCWVSHPL